MSIEVFLQKEHKDSRRPMRLAQPLPAPESRGNIFTDTIFFEQKAARTNLFLTMSAA